MKVPADFAGSGAKFDDAGDGDGDEENADEEEDIPIAKATRRRGQGKFTLPSNAVRFLPPSVLFPPFKIGRAHV